MTHERLSHIEQKLDKLSEAVISMARMEDRLVSVFKRLDRVDEGFKKSQTNAWISWSKPASNEVKP